MPNWKGGNFLIKKRGLGGETLAPVNPSMAFALFIEANFVLLAICCDQVYVRLMTWRFLIG